MIFVAFRRGKAAYFLRSMGEIWFYILAGSAARLVDGALGMACGLTASTFLISFGVIPAIASAAVNAAESFVTLSASIVFLVTLGLQNGYTILGLALCGIPAAPIGACAVKRISLKPLMVGAGLLIV